MTTSQRPPDRRRGLPDRLVLGRIIATAAAATACLTVIVTFTAPRTHAQPPTPRTGAVVGYVGLVVDISGSMNDDDGTGIVKLDGAKQAVTALLDGLPEHGTGVGLVTYPTDDDLCLGDLRKDVYSTPSTVDATVRNLKAGGGTPTGPALALMAAHMLDNHIDTTNSMIVLVSDGESNCGPPPCEVANHIVDAGYQITVNTIGFQVSSAGADELRCVANATGGVFYQASDAGELGDQLDELGGATLSVDVDAPDTVRRNVGVASYTAASPVTVTVDVRDIAPVEATDVRVYLETTSDRRPAILEPVRFLGNIAPDGQATTSWSFYPTIGFEDFDVTFELSASAANAATITRTITIHFQGSISLAETGPLLAGKEHVVILGDSYSSGEGAGDYLPGTDTDTNRCHRSPNTYGKDLWGGPTNSGQPGSRMIIACSGAVLADLYGSQNPSTAAQLSQLDALPFDADLVLMSIGGNDAEFTTTILACLAPGDCYQRQHISEVPCDSPRVDIMQSDLPDGLNTSLLELDLSPRCFDELGLDGDIKIAELAGLQPRLVQAYIDVDDRVNAPDRILARAGEVAPIVVMAYPDPLPDFDHYSAQIENCPRAMTFTEWKWLKEYVAAVNDTVRSAVETAASRGVPIAFADTVATAFQPSHTVCDFDKDINYLDVSATASRLFQVAGLIGLDWLLRGVTLVDLPLPSSTADSRRISEQFHPNADGYRAETAALVAFSLSDAGAAVQRDRPPQVDFPELPPGQAIDIASVSPSDVTRGRTITVIADGLRPGSTALAIYQSSPVIAARGNVDATGNVTFKVPIPANFPTGDHTITVVGTDADGMPISRSHPIVVDDTHSFWYDHGQTTALITAAFAAAFTVVAGTAIWLRQRRTSRPRTASV